MQRLDNFLLCMVRETAENIIFQKSMLSQLACLLSR
ncbi:hypothetical protein GGQ94_002070 [Petrimonas sulfuriphila]